MEKMQLFGFILCFIFLVQNLFGLQSYWQKIHNKKGSYKSISSLKTGNFSQYVRN